MSYPYYLLGTLSVTDTASFDFDGDEEFEFKSATDNPDLANAAAALADEEAPPKLEDPQDGPVRLVHGFRRLNPGGAAEEVTTAWVRELNGEDEERISKARMRGDAMAHIEAILQGGVDRLGSQPPTKDELLGLVAGDRDYLLLEISRATYGNEIEYDEFPCPFCGDTIDITVHKDEDIPVDRLEEPLGTFDVRLKGDRVASVRLVTGDEMEKIARTETPAEANTVIIAHCVEEIRGPKGTTRFDGDLDAARRLGVSDRQTIIEALSKAMPGPKYNGVRFTHPDCGNEVQFEVTLADLFRGM